MKFWKQLLTTSFLLSISTITAWATTGTVYKHSQCSCCTKWEEHMRAHDFQLKTHKTTAMQQIKNQLGIDREVRSCHTAVLEDGILIEGHVPAHVVARFLKERPEGFVGLAVPGMPMGSPGMEHPTRKNSYDVLLFDQEGNTQVYEHIE